MLRPNTADGQRLFPVKRYITGVDDKHPRFRFPAKAKRYTDEQYAIVIRSPRLMGTVMLGRYGLVNSNFALAEAANSQARLVQTVRFSDLTRIDISAFIQALTETATRYHWTPEMLDVELQFLGDYR